MDRDVAAASMASAPAAVLWDVDGTLAETELDGHRVAYNRAFRDCGLPWHWDRACYLRLLATSGGRERLARHAREVSWSEALPLDELMRCKQGHYRDLMASGRLRLRPGIRPLMQELVAAGIPQAIVTTSGRSAVTALLHSLLADLAPHLAVRICGEDVTRKKPDPQAYDLAVQSLQVPAARCCAVEDSPAGLAAAVAAGVPCVLVRSSLSAAIPAAELAARGARAVLPGLEAEAPGRSLPVEHGPPCASGRVTLSYLRLAVE
jgi:HAD superfamily hydrolase (TIGR01509 family)